MSNSLLNKLKVIDNSRNRLKTILQEKDVATSGNSLPTLIEDVNGLYKPNVTPTEWNGVPIEEEPDYYKPGIDFDTIYENDTDKDSYSTVVMYLIKVEDGAVNTLGQNLVHNMTKYKFSDDLVLRNPARSTESPSHTWNTANDILGTDGNHYRWIMGYTNASISPDYNATYWQAEAMIVFKGTITGLGIRDQQSAPTYVEIKSNVNIQGYIVSSEAGYICTGLRTFICNASTAGFNDAVFQNCINLEFFKCTSNIYGTPNYNYLFDGCFNLKYCYFKEVYQTYECTFRYCRDCYIYIGRYRGTYFGRNDNRYCMLAQTNNVRMHVGQIDGYFGWIASDRDGINFSKNLQLEVDDVKSYIAENVCNQYYVNATGIMIHKIGGSVNANAFLDCPLYGTIEFYNGNNSASQIFTSAFAGTKLTKAIFNNSNISAINDEAFRGSTISAIEINAGVTTINNYVFKDCFNLKSFTVGDTVTTLSANAFRESCIENVVMGAGIASIPANLFRYAPQVRNVVLHEDTIALGEYTFAYTKLKTITLPAGITSIPNYCFIESSIEEIISEGEITSIGKQAFNRCYKLTSFDISHLETVGQLAFEGTSISNFELPKSLTAYDVEAFAYMHKHIYFNREFVPSGNLSLAGTNLDLANVLETLYHLPDGGGYTLTTFPTMKNGATQPNYRFYDSIKNRKITVNEDGLAWDDSGSQTVAQYVASKNWIVV